MPVPLVDFSTLGDLGNIYQQSRRQAAREQALGQLGQGSGPLEYGQAAKALLAAGDTEGGLSLARLAEASSRDVRDFGFRKEEAQRAQSNADRAFALQKQQAEEQARGFDYREIDDPATGGKKLVRIEKATGAISAPPIAGATEAPSNPFAFGKQTEAQSKDSGYADRMFRAESVLRDPKVEDAATSLGQNMLGKAPGFVSNYLTGPDFQRFDQAKRDFVNAVLRRESGAAISQSEFDNANKQYFPQPGDTPERIAEKKRNRQDAIAGVAGGGGPTYKPPYTFGPGGELIQSKSPPRGTTQPAAAPATPKIDNARVSEARANPAATLEQARAAIQGGKAREPIIQFLRAAGIDPSGL